MEVDPIRELLVAAAVVWWQRERLLMGAFVSVEATGGWEDDDGVLLRDNVLQRRGCYKLV